MFRALHSSQIDATKWNQAVELSHGEIYSTYEYLHAVTLGDWRGVIKGDYEKVLPYYQKKKWGLIPYICMPPFSQKYNNSPWSDIEFERLVEDIKSQNYRVDMRVTDKKSYSGIAKSNFVLSKKNRSYEELSGQYSRLLQRNLKSKNVEITSVSREDSIAFLKVNDLFQNLVWKNHAASFLTLISKEFVHCIQATESQNNTPLGVLIYAVYRDVAYLLFPYQSAMGKSMNAMSFLIDSLIRDPFIKTINFEGSSIVSIANFYRQFGAEEETYWEMRL